MSRPVYCQATPSGVPIPFASARCKRLGGAGRFAILSGLAMCSVGSLSAQSSETPQTRLRPISQRSAVEQYLGPASSLPQPVPASPVVNAWWGESQAVPTGSRVAESNPTSDRHLMRMQFQLPPGNGFPTTAPPIAPSDATTMPPPSLGTTTQPIQPSRTPAPGTAPPTATVAPMTSPPRGLPMNPGATTLAPLTTVPGGADLMPVAPPQLHDQFATIDNCSCISPPSSYVAATGWTQNCAPTTSYVANPAPSAYLAPAGQVTAPAVVTGPPVIPDASTLPPGSGVPRHALISLGQDRNPIVVGQGIIGQPVAYVPGQPIRNWIRYLFP